MAPADTLQLSLDLGEVLGEGTSGVVAPLLASADGGRYVAKRVKAAGPESAASLAHEVRLHKLCSAACGAVVRYAFACQTPDELIVLMEACDLNLWEALTGGPSWAGLASGPPSQAEMRGWMLQLCEAVRSCHAHRVLHRDVNPWNVFLVRGAGELCRAQVRLGDFGLAVELPAGVEELRGIGASGGAVALDESALTSLYSAPELGERYGFPADVFSTGMTLLALWTAAEGSEDFVIETVEAVKLTAKESAGGSQGSRPKLKFPELATAAEQRKLIVAMVSGDPAARPTALEAHKAADDGGESVQLGVAGAQVRGNGTEEGLIGDTPSRTKQIFKRFAAGSGGQLSRSDLASILDALGNPASHQDAIVDAVFSTMGERGSVEVDRFLQWIFHGAN